MKTYKYNFTVKLRAIFELIFSKKFALLTFENRTRDLGAVEGFFSKGFTKQQQNYIMSEAQYHHTQNMVNENLKSIIDEASQILNKLK